jgi:putative transposase
MDILALLQCLHPTLSNTTLRQFSRIILALLALSGRVTMLGLSRWTDAGGSYRTVQRWFYTVIPWAQVFWLFFRQHLFRATDVYVLAGDEVVVTKAGQHTYGLDRFFSGLLKKPVPGIAFFALSLVSTTERRAFPIQLEQVVRSASAPAAVQAKSESEQTARKRSRGRPTGSQNRNKTEVGLNPELLRIQTMVHTLLRLCSGMLSLGYLALDGHFGNNAALQMTRQCGLQLISKLRADSALYLPYTGTQPRKGARRKYGDKIDYRNLPVALLHQTRIEGELETRIYHGSLLHKEFSQALNVVMIVKQNLKTQAWAHVVLFSSDLSLSAEQIIAYYSLRFQIEFNFRDAKQYWGLEDFMNVSQTAVTNAANLSLFMANVAQRLLNDFRVDQPLFSVLDLKAYYRGCKYVRETIKMLPQKPDANFIAHLFRQLTALGRIHTPHAPLASA